MVPGSLNRRNLAKAKRTTGSFAVLGEMVAATSSLYGPSPGWNVAGSPDSTLSPTLVKFLPIKRGSCLAKCFGRRPLFRRQAAIVDYWSGCKLSPNYTIPGPHAAAEPLPRCSFPTSPSVTSNHISIFLGLRSYFNVNAAASALVQRLAIFLHIAKCQNTTSRWHTGPPTGSYFPCRGLKLPTNHYP